MPRYFFHFNDGKRTFTDSTGSELVGIVAARNHACEQIRDMLSAKMVAPSRLDRLEDDHFRCERENDSCLSGFLPIRLPGESTRHYRVSRKWVLMHAPRDPGQS